jgi:hypothetical protein
MGFLVLSATMAKTNGYVGIVWGGEKKYPKPLKGVYYRLIFKYLRY